MENVNIKINGMPLSVPNGISILEAARYAGIEIPTLCFLKDINEIGACRLCVVEAQETLLRRVFSPWPRVWKYSPILRRSDVRERPLLSLYFQLMIKNV